MFEDLIAQIRYRVVAAIKKPRFDVPLLSGLVALMAVGLVTLYSASDLDRGTVIAQALRFVLGLFLMLLIARVSPLSLRNWTPWLYVGSVMLLVAVACVSGGTQRHGAAGAAGDAG